MLDKIIEILGDFVDTDGIDVTAETSLKNDLGMNSFDYVSVSTELESVFGVDIPDNIIGTVKTVGDLVELVEKASK